MRLSKSKALVKRRAAEQKLVLAAGLTREARVRLKTGNKGLDKMDVRPEQT